MQKAYDIVNQHFLLKTLSAFGFDELQATRLEDVSQVAGFSFLLLVSYLVFSNPVEDLDKEILLHLLCLSLSAEIHSHGLQHLVEIYPEIIFGLMASYLSPIFPLQMTYSFLFTGKKVQVKKLFLLWPIRQIYRDKRLIIIRVAFWYPERLQLLPFANGTSHGNQSADIALGLSGDATIKRSQRGSLFDGMLKQK